MCKYVRACCFAWQTVKAITNTRDTARQGICPLQAGCLPDLSR